MFAIGAVEVVLPRFGRELGGVQARAGATVMFSEVTEVRDGVLLLTPRALNDEVGRALIDQMDWYDRCLARGETDRAVNTTPGNKTISTPGGSPPAKPALKISAGRFFS